MRLLLLAGALAAAAVTPVPASAAAAPGAITCTGGEIAFTISPGLTLTPKDRWLSLAGPVGHCVTPDHPSISSGVLRAHGAFTGACPGPLNPADLELSIAWNDGTVSTVTGAKLHADLRQWTLLPGTITSGPFTGDGLAALGRSQGLPDPWVIPCVVGGLNHLGTVVTAFAVG
ncbi:hypothetical protein [Herbidospora daliensis]|uniref:hypothetical protein n=1 Tax=Herbidospora daliensis TaxID=295585 RepID=UPI000B2C99D7|nr:hypothetical protein [Herbidospora daliensis]